VRTSGGLFGQPPVNQAHDPVGQLGKALVMGHDDKGLAKITV